MPLIALNDHIDPLEHAKIALGYALPKSHAAGLWGLQGMGLGCGGDCKCGPCAARGMNDWVPTESEVKAGSSTAPLGQQYFKAQNRPSSGGGGDLVSNFVSSIKSNLIDPLLQASTLRAQAKANRSQIVTQHAPDYTTPAIIVGGAVLAGMLFFSLAKKRS